MLQLRKMERRIITCNRNKVRSQARPYYIYFCSLFV